MVVKKANDKPTGCGTFVRHLVGLPSASPMPQMAFESSGGQGVWFEMGGAIQQETESKRTSIARSLVLRLLGH